MAGCGVPHFQTNPGCLFHPVCMPRFDTHSFSCFPKKSFPLTTLGLCNLSRQISIFWYMISHPYIASSKGFIFEPQFLPQVLGWTGVTRFGKHHFKGTEQFQPCSVVWHMFTTCIDESYKNTLANIPNGLPNDHHQIGSSNASLIGKNHPMSFLKLN